MNLKQLLFAASFCLLGISADAQFYFFFDYNYNRAIVDHVNRDKERIQREGISSRTEEVKEYDYYGDLSKKEERYYDDSLDLERTYQYNCGHGNSLLPQNKKIR